MNPSGPLGFSRSCFRALNGIIVLALLLSAQPVWGQAPGQPEPPFVEDEILVKLKPGVAANAGVSALAAFSAVAQPSPELAKIGVRVFKVPRGKVLETLASLHQNPQIEFSEPNYLVQAADAIAPTIPNDPYWSSQWGPPDIQAPLAWSVTTGTASVTIAVIDTGVDLTHPELASKIDLLNSTSFVTYTTSAQDDNGHGTHVAGIAAAVGNNGTGIAGMNWGARIMALKVLNNAGIGSEGDVATAMIYAADHGARVINLSLGGTADPGGVMGIAATYAYTSGVTVVAAAGNQGSPNVLYPAAYPNVIAVASVDSNNRQSYFSNYGPQVALAAPGGFDSHGYGIYSTCLGGGYCYMSGTSMATPHVAGAAALLASLPQLNTPDRIRAALQSTAKDLGTPGWDQYYGYGLVQAYDALKYDYHTDINPTTAFGFSPADSVVTYSLTMSNTGVFTDSYAVTVSAGVSFTTTVTPALISDLAPTTSAPVTVTVTIPDAAPRGTSQADTVTITSQTVPTAQATATLTTVVPYTLRLLLIFR